jgi:hypothetical protein
MLGALGLSGAALLLAACETIPDAGSTITAQVLALPKDRAALGGGHSHLYSALRAGVTRAEAERGRVATGQCGDVDASASGGVRWRVATTVLPDGLKAAPGLLVEIDVPASAGEVRPHGVFVATVKDPDPAHFVRSAVGDAMRPLCRPPGAPEGRWRLQVRGAVPAWEFDFAMPELARRDRFTDAELAAGRVAVVVCQLKVADGSDWNRPSWLARLPAGLTLRVGDVVRVRAGASEMGKAVEPATEVLAVVPGATAPGGLAVVRCH